MHSIPSHSIYSIVVLSVFFADEYVDNDATIVTKTIKWGKTIIEEVRKGST